jgi:hypothetical protein
MPTSAAKGGIVTKPRHAVKSFEVAARAAMPEAKREPLWFDLFYLDSDGEEHKSPEFPARPWMISDIDLMQIPNMEVSQDSVALWRVFQSALGDAYGDFDRWIHGPDVFVDAERIIPVLMWFVEEATGRPTVPS